MTGLQNVSVHHERPETHVAEQQFDVEAPIHSIYLWEELSQVREALASSQETEKRLLKLVEDARQVLIDAQRQIADAEARASEAESRAEKAEAELRSLAASAEEKPRDLGFYNDELRRLREMIDNGGRR
jgi:chromosome segregation ATPase